MVILHYIYYILEVIAVYLALVGTWEIAQATVARGLLPEVMQKKESEKTYKPLSALNPLNKKTMLTWWFNWKSEERGIADIQILKKRFSWGLRYLMLSIVLMYILKRAECLFF